VLLKLTAPGVPDLYQGTELWDLSLVDPDNRRPVDYEIRRRLLAELKALTPEQVMSRSDEGLPKLYLIEKALTLRQRVPPDQLYEPLYAEGRRGDHVVAFSRGPWITVTPRLVMPWIFPAAGGATSSPATPSPAGPWSETSWRASPSPSWCAHEPA
jgi:(1->4)-alpha-D-glucan 1-alpha-D-glucosylmutase